MIFPEFRKLKLLAAALLLAVCMLPAGICRAEEVQESAQTETAAEETDTEESETAAEEDSAAAPLSAGAGAGLSFSGLNDVTAVPEWPDGPEVSAESVFMFEKRSGEVLFSKDPDAVSFPASTTKIMTALLTLENCKLDEEVTFSHDAIYDIEEGGHHYEFEEGEVLTVDECLQFLLVESVNEVGYALAEHIGGSLSGFADMMNARAKELGCENTHFVNPHGLNDPEHVTTARDMALIMSACVENEDFRRYASQTSVKLAGRVIRTEGFSKYTNHHLMLQPDSEFYDPDVVCGKTGFTSLAGNTLVTYAEKEGMEVVCVLMKGLSDRFNDTKLLLDYAFNDFNLVTGENVSEIFPDVYDELGRGQEDVEMPDLALMVPDLADETKLSVSFDPKETDPTEEDLSIGTLQFSYGQAALGETNVLLTDEAYEVWAESRAEESIAAAETAEGESYAEETEIFGWTSGELIFLALMFVMLVVLLILLFWLIGQRIKWNREIRRKYRNRKR
ncbi:MAG: D-alanyl-D-alanine carboxypeptidase [Lachnospiraceae bacterium]|nr:D-alanyl-D-alanine carboxypeptidase [Lachnospiraceae bacterium]